MYCLFNLWNILLKPMYNLKILTKLLSQNITIKGL